jgi:LysM repeat protein
MNSWKNLFFLAILAVVGWGLYVSLTRPPGSESKVPKEAENVATVPAEVQLGQLVTAPPASPGDQAPAKSPGAELAPPLSVPGPGTPAPAVVTSPQVPPPPPDAGPAPTAPATVAPYGPPPPPEAPQGPPLPPGSPPGPPPPLQAATAVTVDAARGKINQVLAMVNAEVDQKRDAEALQLLSSLYGSPDVPADMTRNINERLDQLAGIVIYSRQHLLEKPYLVQQGDTLERVAESYNVPPVLLARINGIHDAQGLRPGRELKVVRGPFSALVSLSKLELTLILQDRYYAGRFQIGIGRDHPPVEGTYDVRAKQSNISVPREYPVGQFRMDLGNMIAIHGTDDVRAVGRTDGRGSIVLRDRDLDDVYGILSVGSKVVIQR